MLSAQEREESIVSSSVILQWLLQCLQIFNFPLVFFLGGIGFGIGCLVGGILGFGWYSVLLGIGGLGSYLGARIYPEEFIMATVVALGISPKIYEPSGTFYVRLDDILYLGLFLVLIEQFCQKRFNWGYNRIEMAFILFLAWMAFSTVRGIGIGEVRPPLEGFLTLVKLLEYLVGFWALGLLVKPGRRLAVLRRGFAIGGVGMALLGGYQIIQFVYLKYTAPFSIFRLFDQGIYPGESNHMAGYLMVACTVFLVNVLDTDETRSVRFRSVVLFSLCALVLYLTRSRSALLGFTGACILVLYVYRKRWLIFGGGVFVVSLLLIPGMKQRLSNLQRNIQYYETIVDKRLQGKPTPFSYSRVRLEVWDVAVSEMKYYPVAGGGFGARNRVFYENIYVMILAEGGWVGVMLFLLFLLQLLFWRRKGKNENSRKQYVEDDDDMVQKTLVSGSTVALMLMGVGAVSFMITRIAGAFWFVLGITIRKYD